MERDIELPPAALPKPPIAVLWMTYVRGAITGRYGDDAVSATYALDERVSYVVVLLYDDEPGPSVRTVVVDDAMTLVAAVDREDDDVTEMRALIHSHCCCCCC